MHRAGRAENRQLKRIDPGTWKLVALLIGVLVLGATVFAFLYSRANHDDRGKLELELAKSILDVTAFAVIGQVVLIIIGIFQERRISRAKELENQSRRWQETRDLLRIDLRDRLDKLYSQAKSSRRRLRGALHTTRIEDSSTQMLDTKQYSDLLVELSEIQLGIEQLKKLAYGAEQISALPTSVSTGLRSMERYLGWLVSEYERVMKDALEKIPLMEMTALCDFIEKSSAQKAKSRFREEFVVPYHHVADALIREIARDLHLPENATQSSPGPPEMG